MGCGSCETAYGLSLPVLLLSVGAVLFPSAFGAVAADFTPPLTAEQVGFIENDGQLPDEVRYYVQGRGGTLFFTDRGIVLDQVLEADLGGNPMAGRGPAIDSTGAVQALVRGVVVRLEFVGANSDLVPEALDRLAGQCNFFLGDRGDGWIRAVPSFARIVYRQLYPGIDLAYYQSDEGPLKYDLVMAPGADLSQVVFQYEGVESVSISAGGELILTTDLGQLVEAEPVAYQEQEDGGTRVLRTGSYRLLGESRVGFEVPDYDPALPLIFDPGLLWSTFLGGGSWDAGLAVSVNANAEIIVAGYTLSTDFPTTPGVYERVNSGLADVFVSKLDPSGSTLLFSTYIGGGDFDVGQAIDVDSSGNILVAGMTRSEDFPITLGAFDVFQSGSHDVFVLKLGAEGDSLLYSTYLGGGDWDEATAVACHEEGSVTLVGRTFSQLYRTTPGSFDAIYNGAGDVFATKLNATGSGLVFSTFLGGESGDRARDMDVDLEGNIYLVGSTRSTAFPTTEGAYDSTPSDSTDVFVAKLSADGGSLIYSTLVGGKSNDEGHAIGVTPFGEVFVSGHTLSPDFPTTAGAFDRTHGGNWDAFFLTLNDAGSELLASTLLGGAGGDFVWDLVVETTGDVVVGGHTTSDDFPTTPDGYDRTFNGGTYDVFLTSFPSSAEFLHTSTYIGGERDELCWALDGDLFLDLKLSSRIIVAGESSSDDFPTTSGAYDTTLSGPLIPDAVVLAIDLSTIHEMETSVDLVGPPRTGTEVSISPNPFNPLVAIRFALSRPSNVEIRVYDARGNRVVTLLKEDREAGDHEITWDGRDEAGRPVASGVYFIRLESNREVSVRKATLLR